MLNVHDLKSMYVNYENCSSNFKQVMDFFFLKG